MCVEFFFVVFVSCLLILNSEFVADKLRSSSSFQRNLVYPIAMLGLLLLTSITVLLVIQNTLEILIGLKALPLSTRVS